MNSVLIDCYKKLTSLIYCTTLISLVNNILCDNFKHCKSASIRFCLIIYIVLGYWSGVVTDLDYYSELTHLDLLGKGLLLMKIFEQKDGIMKIILGERYAFQLLPLCTMIWWKTNDVDKSCSEWCVFPWRTKNIRTFAIEIDENTLFWNGSDI